MTLTHGSLFTGVGGFDLGADAAGIETLWQCEIDKKARSVLAKHWPSTKRYEDVRDVKGDQIAPVDIISFGSPCQDLSVAGKRAGLAGSRSGLFHESLRIAKEMRNATDNQYPRFLIWENVRGALSSNEGKDFYAAIQAMAKLGALDVSYRLVNACHFGVPQRRVRVFVVADLTGQLAGEILAQPTRLLWHPSSIGEQRQEASGEVEKSTRRSKWKPSQSILAALPQHVAQGADDNCAQGGYLAYSDKHAGWTKNDLASSVCVKWAKGTGGPSGSEHYNLVLETETLNRVPYVKTVRSGKRDDEGNLPAEQWAERQVAPTLNLMDNGGETRATVLAVDGYNQKTDERLFHALRTEKDSGDSVLDTTYRVRRLTPVECERLMGWPDDHTRYDDKGNELSDTARYKMCGNGIATPVARWLCENLVSSVLNEKQANPS